MADIVMLGGGNLGSALARGWLFPDKNINTLVIVTQSGQARDPALASFVTGRLDALSDEAIIILAVKPQNIRAALAPFMPLIRYHCIVSTVAGVRLDHLQRIVPQARWMRAMPSVAAAERKSITGLLNCDTNITNLFCRLGSVITVHNDDGIDAITALVACGTGVMAAQAQAWVEAAAALIPDQKSLRGLIAGMIESSGALLRQSDDFAGLAAQVATKGGMTEAMIHALSAYKMEDSIQSALDAALKRARDIDRETV